MTDEQINTITSLYERWRQMKRRCTSVTNRAYADYGGRGITVCKAWQDFPTFYRWALSSGYKSHLTLERKNVNRGYCPSNCEWIPKAMQNRNKQNTILTTKIAAECKWLAEQGLSYAAIGREYGAGASSVRQVAIGQTFTEVVACRPRNWKYLVDSLPQRRGQ